MRPVPPPVGYRINDCVRQLPFELFGDLEAHRFLAFDPVRLFQGRDVEPAVFRAESLNSICAAQRYAQGNASKMRVHLRQTRTARFARDRYALSLSCVFLIGADMRKRPNRLAQEMHYLRDL